MTREFRPGFRLSALDVCVLVAGATGAIAVWRAAPEFAGLGAVAILHFFLFCNVFRVARRPELVWSAVFLICVLARTALGTPWPVLAGIVAATTVAVLWLEARKPSYHGVLWRRVNPGLEAWWAKQPH